MKLAVVCLAVLGLTCASPSGYYHQEYDYKASAASYKNNELQHKTDDMGFYSKDGDLDGYVKPKVTSNSEHSEYVNPKLREYNTAFIGGAGGDTSSYGHLRAEQSIGNSHGGSFHGGSSSLGTQSSSYQDIEAEGITSSDHITGPRGLHNLQDAYGSSGSNAYGSSQYGSAMHGSSNAYGYGSSSSSSSLEALSSRVQNELQRELDADLHNNRITLAELEGDLHRRLSERFEEALRQQYGQQSIRGGYSYTLDRGKLQATANYPQQQYLDLKRQLEDRLLQQLRADYGHRSSSSNHYSSVHTASDDYRQKYIQTTTYRPYNPVYESQPQPQPQPQPSNIRYTPVPNPDSITTIAHRVQTQLDSKLNELLDETQRTYFSPTSNYRGDLDALLDRLREQIRSNITYQLDEELRRQYGAQEQRNGYMYSVGPRGQPSGMHNYKVDDLLSLRRQIENNLLEKLNRDFNNYRTRWQSERHSTYRETNTGYDYTTVRTFIPGGSSDIHPLPLQNVPGPAYGHTTPRYDVDYPGRPTSASIVPMISNGIKGGRRYEYNAQGGYQVSGASSQNVAELQRQLQSQLSRQLQEAIARNAASRHSFGYGGQQGYDTSFQTLSDELNRNLTRQLDDYQYGSSAGGYGSSSAYRGVDQAQLARLRSQLQQDLTSQLQQGLQQSYSSSASSSYSASSSSHSGGGYRAARGFENNAAYGQYKSGSGYPMEGEDCEGDDPYAYHRVRRSYTYTPYRSRPLGISQGSYGSAGYNGYQSGAYSGAYGSSYRRASPTQTEATGQVEDESDLTQHMEENSDLQGQKVDESDLTQNVQHEDFGKLQLGNQQGQVEIGQEIDDSDLTQKVEINSDDFAKLQIGSQQSTTPKSATRPHRLQSAYNVGQIGSSDLTQQVQSGADDFLQLQSGYQQLPTPRTETRPSRLYSGSQVGKVEDSDLTQQVQINTDDFLKLQSGNQQLPTPRTETRPSRLHSESQVGQVEDDSDLTQQVEHGFNNFQRGSSAGQVHSSQISQVTENVLGGLDQENQVGQQIDNSDLTQQVEDTSGKIHAGNQIGQEEDNSDITQQVETSGFVPLNPNPRENQNSPVNSYRRPNQENNLNHSQLGYFDSTQNANNDQTIGTPQGSTRPAYNNRDRSFSYSGSNRLKAHRQTRIETSLQQEITQQIQNACSNLITSNDDQQISYQKLLDQMNRNITEQMDNLRRKNELSGDFNRIELMELRERLERNMKQALQQNIQQTYNMKQQSTGYQLGLINNGNTDRQPVSLNQLNGNRDTNPDPGQINTLSTSHNSDLIQTQERPFRTDGTLAGNIGTLNDNTQFISPKPSNDLRRTYDFHQREINQQNQYHHLVSSATQRPIPTLNQVTNDIQQSPNNPNDLNVDAALTNNPNKDNVQRPESLNIPNAPDQQRPMPVGTVETGSATNRQNSRGTMILQSGQPQYVPYDRRTSPSLPTQLSSTSNPIFPQSSPVSSIEPLVTNDQNMPKSGNSMLETSSPSAGTGNQFGISSQGEIYSRPMTMDEAERQSDILIEQIRRQAEINRQRTQFNSNGPSRPQFTSYADAAAYRPNGPKRDSESHPILTPSQSLIARDIERELSQEVEDAIKTQYQLALDTYGSASSQAYENCNRKLKESLKRNLTELITGASEPGLSKYSDKISGKFNSQELQDLQKLLDDNLTKTIEDRLNRIFGRNMHTYDQHSHSSSYGSHSYSSGSSVHGYRVNYGRHDSFNPQYETTHEIQPIVPQYGNPVQNVGVYRGGVKGGRTYHQVQPSAAMINPQPSEHQFELSSSTTENANEQVEIIGITTSTENPGWWKRFGNKVKEGAKSLKEKVGL